ncbi:MAG: ribosomal protein S18-alanine N-acetyltransferase [Armatimonadota bacterium]
MESAPRNETEPIILRRASILDLEPIMDIEVASFPSPWPSSTMLAELSRDDGVAYYTVARRGDAVVGYAGMWYVAGEGHILTLAVSPEHRKQGIGERLLVRLVEEVAERGGHRVYLEYRVSNFPARRLYEKYGFRYLYTRPRYYRDTGEDAIVVALDGLQSSRFIERLSEWKRTLQMD